MAKKRIITDIEITEAWKKGIRSIEIDNDTIITPQAQDSAKVKNIIFVKNQLITCKKQGFSNRLMVYKLYNTTSNGKNIYYSKQSNKRHC